jgi:hypothetical protein
MNSNGSGSIRKKRERLVLARADILIPDYSWTAKLANM